MSERKGDWMQTFRGVQFYPLDPRPEEIQIEDIAHALSNQCRYAGHCTRFYCPTPDQRVLTADLRWLPAGDLVLGQELVGFDEEPIGPGSCGKKRRRFRPTVVTHMQPVKRRIIRLEMEDGSTVTSSAGHPWLIATKVSRNQAWACAKSIAKSLSEGRARYMHRFYDTWSTVNTRDAGWLAGMYDGEGYLSSTNRGGVQLGIAQKVGPTLDAIAESHRVHGFGALRYAQTGNPGSQVVSLQLTGGIREILRFLGVIRPARLISKFQAALLGGQMAKQMDGSGAPSRIVKAWSEKREWVTGIETSTHTYFCEGYAAHNSVAQHSVLVARTVPRQHFAWGLLHDAAEAYLVDLPRPLKRFSELGNVYWPIEARLMMCVCERFGLPYAEPPEIKEADNVLLMTEKRDLMPNSPAKWTETATPLAEAIIPWQPERAEAEFLEAFRDAVWMGAKR